MPEKKKKRFNFYEITEIFLKKSYTRVYIYFMNNIFHYINVDDNDDRLLFMLQTELSQNLQQLSERARSTTEFIQRLKGMTDKVHVSINTYIRAFARHLFSIIFLYTSGIEENSEKRESHSKIKKKSRPLGRIYLYIYIL